jgi:hypothetical protein
MRFNLALLVLPLLAACATAEEEYPSLAIRDAERVSGRFEPVAATPYVPPPTPAAVLGLLDQLAADAASAHRSFVAEAPAASRIIQAAGGAEFGSDAWAAASVALAGLESSRS